MTEQDADLSTWLTVPEAARAYGVSVRTIWRRLRAHQLPARQLFTPTGTEWRIAPPPDTAASALPPSSSGDRLPWPRLARVSPGVSDLVPLATVERLLAPLATERDRLRADLDTERAARLVDAAAHHAARLADREEIGRLRGLLEAAQQEQPPTTPHPRRRWPWQRG